MNVLVFGGGNVGLGLASCLIKAGCAVTIYGRAEVVQELRRYGLRRSGIFGNYHAAAGSFNAVTSPRDISDQHYDWVLVCVKSYDTRQAATSLLRQRDAGSRFVLCQNGLGNLETFSQDYDPARVFVSRIITGFRRIGMSQVHVTVHAAPVHVGHPDPARSQEAKALCDAIARGGIPSQVSATIMKDIWAKVLYNVLLNPLGAILGVPYGVLGESEHTRLIMDRLAEESYPVMLASGGSTNWPTAVAFLDVFYEWMLPPTAGHESSMLQDLRAGHHTEIDALNGAIVALGRRHGIATPVNESITEMVKFLEQRSGRVEDTKH